VQKGVLELLLGSTSQRLWSVAEVEREVGEQLSTVDVIAGLQAAGLIRRCGKFVFASRSALAMDALSRSRGSAHWPCRIARDRFWSLAWRSGIRPR
jgi:hypothetical protein